ncbi:protein SHQ1 homolog [Octodon degus]|uniref:Protein SHQ1 homolog n=1 Tax=Octodon degus TaxID=10160 RepID=A0A6P3F539_OCTDE|nr:protein SHQ1 homolog [Octodon degus]
MLTPAFDLSQDADFLTVAIRLPYARVSEFDVYFEGVDFKFYAKPYFLRLTLPGRIIENGNEQGSYDADKGLFTIRLPKETPGQHFEGLNMLTALLAPRKSRTAKPLVEEIGASEVSEEVVEDDDEELDWEIDQTPYEEATESALNPQCPYGFGNLRAGVFQRLQDELSEVIDVKNPDFTPAAERRQKRLTAELAKFDPDHYLADFFENEAVEQILKYRPWWCDAYSKMVASLENRQEQDHAGFVSFSEEEKYQLRKFVNKSYLLDKRAHQQVYYSLIDILLAYCYEIQVTEGERNVESAWAIRKLSPTLCWFETWTNVHEILVAFGRRVLCYPLYRHFKLVMKAHRDTVKILQLGKSAVLKCLLDIHRIFQENDPAYILNDLYISDYCVWIQKAKSKKLSTLAKALKEASLTKAQLGLELEELETAARLVQEEEAAGKVAPSASPPAPGSSPEAGDSGSSESESELESDSESESEGTPSPGTEDSAAEELSGSQGAPVTSPLGPFLQAASSALPVSTRPVRDGVACVDTPGQALRPLIEELGEQLRATLQVAQPEGTTAVSHSSMQGSEASDAE